MVLRSIASKYENLKCVECTLELKDYLLSQGIHGKRIKLFTGKATGPDCFIFDDSNPTEAISTNGRHEGIAITINGIELIFDNHHPDGITRNEWMANLLFQGKLHFNQQFRVTEEEF
ncbi:papain fold toxin domain-containing protein [Aerosakkonemataceae cyanobacterium BLCC-F50]|uniref:Papain fold toxin domain-containing protein n=1 Tax=Floridaenema flaviceps BLCC-F50 TaxID=3153642 RepID=A0ABV4XR33_9CYAN